ncbi:hypothetical protein [Polyangium mundeleinium]|uniref:Uncharacterized protein n=1 Tax=Polyangium mundeleinium TaxID=2995306 RepID=A0ABT5EF44_9BACT|nr:hypothetical protein [Polyangium mundeleinium]MDC0740438.1 hypothetical protein [Polyangium mundeleinium]
MVEIKRTGDLETSEDLAFERTSMRVRRVGRAVLFLFVLLAALGLFGEGPLSHATAGDASGFFVRYERFTRVDGATRFEIRPRAQSSAAPRRLFLSASLFERGHIEHFVPEPSLVEIHADRSAITFPRVEAGASSCSSCAPRAPVSSASPSVRRAALRSLSLFVYP